MATATGHAGLWHTSSCAKLQPTVRSAAGALLLAGQGNSRTSSCCCHRSAAPGSVERAPHDPVGTADDDRVGGSGRRAALHSATAAAVGGLLWPLLRGGGVARAIQGYTAGRLPGLSGADAQGLYTYRRPEGKSGGHGVGWSVIPRYEFKVPSGWQDQPVSIADLGGTEIDLRFGNPDQGALMVVVAPVMRFRDVGFNADVRIEELGDPDKIMGGFGPELFGRPLDAEDITDTAVERKGKLTYYKWSVKPHTLVSATAVGNRLFILTVKANSRQWKRYAPELRAIADSFEVPPTDAA